MRFKYAFYLFIYLEDDFNLEVIFSFPSQFYQIRKWKRPGFENTSWEHIYLEVRVCHNINKIVCLTFFAFIKFLVQEGKVRMREETSSDS